VSPSLGESDGCRVRAQKAEKTSDAVAQETKDRPRLPKEPKRENFPDEEDFQEA
jgi:hypothetical protein